MNSMIISVVSIDGNGNGDGLIKVPMMGNVKLGLKLEGIKVAEGGCIVEGKANLSGVSLSVLNDKQLEEMKKAYDTFRLVTQTAKQYAPEIATALNKAIAVVDAIGDLSQKISEKKRNTKALIETFDASKLEDFQGNCQSLDSDMSALQDSLEKTIVLVKEGKIKAKLADLQAACTKNLSFMNSLRTAIAECKGIVAPDPRQGCSGPCGGDLADFWHIEWKCTQKTDIEAEFGALFEVGESSSSTREENCAYIYTVLTYLQIGYASSHQTQLPIDLDITQRCYTCESLDLHTKDRIKAENIEICVAANKQGAYSVVDLSKMGITYKTIFLKNTSGSSNPLNISADNIQTIRDYIRDDNNSITDALSKMESLAAKHIPYSQQGEREASKPHSDLAYDCSEFVGTYLMKLGISNTTNIFTGVMTDQESFRNAIGSKNIEYIEGSAEKRFIPQKGDIFVWRISSGGHTGIVLEYNASNDSVTILESIGSSCSADETFNRNNGGDTNCGGTRKAVYRRDGGALQGRTKDKGWKGYFRPIIK